MPKRIAIIPARGGSKRIPKKNIRDFFGKPMIAHMLDAARKADIFDTIHVSTDNEEIAEIAEKLGFKPDFLRAPELADDYTPIFDVVRFVAKKYEEKESIYDTHCLLFPTAPLTNPDDLKRACEAFENGPQDKTLMSISEFPCPVEWAFRKDGNGILSPCVPGGFAKRSQDLEPAYFDAAMFVFASRDYVLNADFSKMDQDYRGFVVPPYRVTDIDTPEDWETAEKLYAALNG